MASTSIDFLTSKFQSIGLTPALSKDAARNTKISTLLSSIIDSFQLKLSDGSPADSGSGSAGGERVDPKQSALVLGVATGVVNSKKLAVEDVGEGGEQAGRVERIVKAVVEGKLETNDQVNAAIKYAESTEKWDESDFEKSCGVGIHLTPTEILTHVRNWINTNLTSLSSTKWSSLGKTLGTLKNTEELRWGAGSGDIKKAVEQVFEEVWGKKEDAKTAGTGAAGKKAKGGAEEKGKGKADKAESKASTSTANGDASTTTTETPSMFEVGFLAALHKPGENPQINPKLRDQHLSATGGQVFTRFPPEPNGLLHIGHAKAIGVNFGFARHHGGLCYLRYDDTNPEAEEKEYFDAILEMVRWLGFEPFKITYSSDHFGELYELAKELVRRDKAYMCSCTAEEIKANRGGEEHLERKACAHRSRPVSESLELFERMKEGHPDMAGATLRMKQDLEDPNPQMWDLVAYRTVKASHHRTGDQWKIYPTYDFTHCLCDSFENITHSLCTTEFILSRQSYDWLCDALEVYKPRQSEYGRLRLNRTVMSKRKILKLVKGGYVLGWDDPRLFTLVALRRRGIPPGAILNFVERLGVTTSTTNIQLSNFEESIRGYLESSTPRVALILRPTKIVLENVEDGFFVEVEKSLHPKVPGMGTVKVPFSKVLYIDSSDFRTEDSKDYFRLAPGKTVGLLNAPHTITCTSFETNETTGRVKTIFCRYNDDPKFAAPKPKAFIQWVAEHPESNSPVKVAETRIFRSLFKSDDPGKLENYLDDIDPESLEVVHGAFLETGIWKVANQAILSAKKEAEAKAAEAKKKIVEAEKLTGKDVHAKSEGEVKAAEIGMEAVRFQGIRVAYFCFDKDTEGVEGLLEGKADGLGGKGKLVLNQIVSLKEDAGKKA